MCEEGTDLSEVYLKVLEYDNIFSLFCLFLLHLFYFAYIWLKYDNLKVS